MHWPFSYTPTQHLHSGTTQSPNMPCWRHLLVTPHPLFTLVEMFPASLQRMFPFTIPSESATPPANRPGSTRTTDVQTWAESGEGWTHGTQTETCSVLSCCAGLASERMECNCERSLQIAEVLFLFVFVFKKSFCSPSCLQDEKITCHPRQMCRSCS